MPSPGDGDEGGEARAREALRCDLLPPSSLPEKSRRYNHQVVMIPRRTPVVGLRNFWIARFRDVFVVATFSEGET